MPEEIFAPLSPAMLADPYPVYAQLRAEEPVHWHDQLGAWVLTRHADCLRVLKDPATFCSDQRKIGREVSWQRLSLQTLDPPDHHALRRPVLAALRSADLGVWGKEVQSLAAETIGPAAGQPLDLLPDVAEPLALRAMCLLYGVRPPADEAAFRAASHALVLSMDAGLDPDRAGPGLAARGLLNDLVEGWFADEHADGMMAQLRAARSQVPAQHLVNTVRALFHAGYASTSSLIGNAILALAVRGELSSERLRTADAALAEELLRLDAPVQATTRACVSDTTLGGRRVRRGDAVVAVFGAANHDPAVFPDPDRACFTRTCHPHLAFGRGAHACLGAHLAIRILLAVLHELGCWNTDLRIVGEPERRPSATLRGLAQLCVAPA